MKIKVLHLVQVLDAIGGMERIVGEIAVHLNKDEFEIEVWCIERGGRFANKLISQGVCVRVFNINSYHNIFNILKLAYALNKSGAHILHAHMYFAATLGRLAGYLAGIPVLINHVHSSYWHYTKRNLFIERLLSNITNKIICVSKSTQDFVVDFEKIDPLKVAVIYNGITELQNSPKNNLRHNFNASHDDIILISVANLLPNKGHRVILKALSLLEIEGRYVKCWFVGEGKIKGQLQQYIQELNIKSTVVFWGERQDVAELLSASDIFVLASLEREGFSISALEALALKVPVIATRVGGLPELIEDQKNGILIAPNDPVSLMKAINELILDKEKLRRLADAGVEKYLNNFQSRHMLAKIEELYRASLKDG